MVKELKYLILFSCVLLNFETTYSHPAHAIFIKMIENKPINEKFKLWHYLMDRPYDLNSNHAVNRYKIFKSNHKYIEKVNSENRGYKLGLGPFADMSYDEFKKDVINNSNGSKHELINTLRTKSVDDEKRHLKSDSKFLKYFDEAADKVDNGEYNSSNYLESNDNDYTGLIDKKTGYQEVKDNLVFDDHSKLFTGVRNQGNCGSCWAFATAAILEAKYSQENSYAMLSTQQLIDCDKTDFGCEGGWYDLSLKYLEKNYLVTEKNYSYKNEDDDKKYECENTEGTRGLVKIKNWKGCDPDTKPCDKGINSLNVLKKGPYATAVYASMELQFYESGVLEYDCADQHIDHAVVVVQYDKDFIKVRNSWSDKWGENGYYKFKRDKKNNSTCYQEKIIYYVEDIDVKSCGDDC